MLRIDWEEIISDNDLIKMYETKSLKAMDKILGVSDKTIGRKLIKLGVKLRPVGWQMGVKR
jgi:hypothetical protein